MLTESVSDPRRANWLTISSMSDDLCWPEESTNSRPNWELEAEILRLTTRLMMRERELKQVKTQLKTQVSKSQQQVAIWRRKIEEKDEQMKELLVKKDAEMQGIVSQLLLFESELRKEQSRIEDLLSEKDVQLLAQQKEIERLKAVVHSQISSISSKKLENSEIRRKVSISSYDKIIDLNTNKFEKASVTNSKRPVSIAEDPLMVTDTQHAVQKLKDGLLKIRGIQDVTNVKNSMDLSYDSVFPEKKRVPYRTPQKVKDLKAKRINSHNKIHRPVMINEITTQAIL